MSGMRKRIELSPDVRDNKRVRYSEDGMAVTTLALSPLGKEVNAATEMEGQTENSYLLEMPTLVIEKILSNVLNLSNVSQTCKYLYDAVCQMEKRKRVACIIRFVELDGGFERLIIDDDVVYDSIMNSRRTITKIQLDDVYRFPYVELNERQLERLTAIIKHFGANITSLVLRCVTLSIDKIIGLLNQTPKLESLEFEGGEAFGRATGSLHLPSLKKLSIRNYRGLLEIVDSLPSGSLNDFRCYFVQLGDHHQEVVQTILWKQHNLKSLQIDGQTDLAVLRVNHLQLEKLKLGDAVTFNSDQLVEMLKCHTNLKEFRLESNHYISVGAFEWICGNLSELEVLQVNVQSPGQKMPSMLRKLKNLRDFSTPEMHFLLDDKFQFKNNSLAKLRICDKSWSSNEEFNQIVRSMARTFTNLTALDIPVEDFSELSAVLSQCTTLIHLTTSITNWMPCELGEKRLPDIRHFFIFLWGNGEEISVMLSIVRAMPNLKKLWMPCSELKFNIKAFKEFIHASKSLEELKVHRFVLDDDWCVTDDFVETFRRLSDQLKAYRFEFEFGGRLNLNPINDILFKEFNVRHYKESVQYSSFVLFKGVLSKFRGYP